MAPRRAFIHKRIAVLEAELQSVVLTEKNTNPALRALRRPQRALAHGDTGPRKFIHSDKVAAQAFVARIFTMKRTG